MRFTGAVEFRTGLEIMKHKHYDMIVAKAANMDLVVFVKNVEVETGGLLSQSVEHIDWSETGEIGAQMPCFHEDLDYFLCLPQHKEVCLHWLNGGDAQKVTTTPIAHLNLGEITEWEEGHIFMNPHVVIRVKPKKEKRWIAVDPSHQQQSTKLFKSEDDLWSYFGGCAGNSSGYQFIEIEVEA